MYSTYNDIVEIMKIDEVGIKLYVNKLNLLIEKKYENIEIESKFIAKLNIDDQVLFEVINGKERIILYVINNDLKMVKELSGKDLAKEFNIKISNKNKKIFMWRYGISEIAILDENRKIILKTNNFLTTQDININNKYDLLQNHESRFEILSIANYKIYNLVLTYDHKLKEFNLCKLILNPIKTSELLDIRVKTRNDVIITNNKNQLKAIVNLRKLKKGKYIKVFKEQLKEQKDGSIISIYAFNKARYYIYNTTTGVYICKSDGIKASGANLNLKIHMNKKNMYIYGRMTHYGKNSFGKYEHLYSRGVENKLGEFKRPFKNIKFLKRFGYFKVSFDSLNKENLIHQNLFIGNEKFYVHNLFFKKNDDKVKTYKYSTDGVNVNIIRTNLQGNITYTNINYSNEYSKMDKIKIEVANYLAKFKKNKIINLYFEKKSLKADESGFRVFEEVMQLKSNKSKNYFILDKKANGYKELKKKYGKNIVRKNSLKHYTLIFLADNFIASELSNHVLNDRLFIDNLRNKIMKVPLIFLQHGIMFAKPVDNPMAFGFHKDKNPYNIKKSVISSKLEAKEFYKMNYDKDDLILTGLATFDYAKLEKNAKKIAFMPTYRYWEEGLIYNNKIEETTYYKIIMKVIKAFEKANLLDQLLIVPHNKFSEYIYKNIPNYSHIISDNPSEALKISKIFITDYSSAIYDAQYRGAYPIFYWEEKDYLIEKYKAIPPVNEKNASGPVVKSIDELLNEVKKAIKLNYKLEKSYMKKYKKINQFNDGKNTHRIVKYLIEQGII